MFGALLPLGINITNHITVYMINIQNKSQQKITSPHNGRIGLAKFIEMDEKVKYSTQMEENVSPVILVNKFNVKPDEVDQFLKAWTADGVIMMQQPGCISGQLHRGIGGSSVFLNYAVWESTEHYKLAFKSPEF